MSFMRKIIIAVIFFEFANLYGNNIPSDPSAIDPAILRQASFDSRCQYCAPNEQKPQNGLAVFRQHPRGTAYLTVGADRALINAALSGANKLVVVDIDPNIIMFHYVNAILIRAASNAKQYRQLRLDTRAWKAFGENMEPMARFWREVVLGDLKDDFEPLHAEVGKSQHCSSPTSVFKRRYDEVYMNMEVNLCEGGDGPAFADGNYLHDEDFFQVVKSIVMQGLFLRQVDLSSEEEVGKLAGDLVAQNIQVGTFDLSNLVLLQDLCKIEDDVEEKSYISASHLLRTLRHFMSIGSRDAQIVLTEVRAIEQDNDFFSHHWFYRREGLRAVMEKKCKDIVDAPGVLYLPASRIGALQRQLGKDTADRLMELWMMVIEKDLLLLLENHGKSH